MKPEMFDIDLNELANFAKVLAHPARLPILQYLAESKSCISGDISDHLPLSRTTVSQHLKELRTLSLIHGEIEGLKINYCLYNTTIIEKLKQFKAFFEPIKVASVPCISNNPCE